jgi:hypothetical protein
MADAAYEILTKDSKSFTGNFCIDDLVLHEAGVTDFKKYANVPFNELMPDFFNNSGLSFKLISIKESLPRSCWITTPVFCSTKIISGQLIFEFLKKICNMNKFVMITFIRVEVTHN